MWRVCLPRNYPSLPKAGLFFRDTIYPGLAGARTDQGTILGQPSGGGLRTLATYPPEAVFPEIIRVPEIIRTVREEAWPFP